MSVSFAFSASASPAANSAACFDSGLPSTPTRMRFMTEPPGRCAQSLQWASRLPRMQQCRVRRAAFAPPRRIWAASRLREARCALIAGRLDAARTWLEGSGLTGLPLVLLGMGTAAAAALLSAAAKPARVRAVVACGPRPDTAGIALRMVSAPALLIAHTGQFSDINAHLRTLARLEVQRDLIVLQDSGDPVDGAVDVARATLRFLDFLGS